jgi:hypothetical protein
MDGIRILVPALSLALHERTLTRHSWGREAAAMDSGTPGRGTQPRQLSRAARSRAVRRPRVARPG